jgi:DNA-binding HxlR family transcriptional regulator
MRYINDSNIDTRGVMEVIGSKWNLMIIWNLREKPLRYTELQKSMGDVNSKTVTTHLRVLEKYHLINRVVYPEIPPRVEYSLTEHGKAILPALMDIWTWGASLPHNENK